MATMQMPVNPLVYLMPHLTVGNIAYFLAAFIVSFALLYQVAFYFDFRSRMGGVPLHINLLLAAVFIAMLLGSDITWLAVNIFLVEIMSLVFLLIAFCIIYGSFFASLLGLVV